MRKTGDRNQRSHRGTRWRRIVVHRCGSRGYSRGLKCEITLEQHSAELQIIQNPKKRMRWRDAISENRAYRFGIPRRARPDYENHYPEECRSIFIDENNRQHSANNLCHKSRRGFQHRSRWKSFLYCGRRAFCDTDSGLYFQIER